MQVWGFSQGEICPNTCICDWANSIRLIAEAALTHNKEGYL